MASGVSNPASSRRPTAAAWAKGKRRKGVFFEKPWNQNETGTACHLLVTILQDSLTDCYEVWKSKEKIVCFTGGLHLGIPPPYRYTRYTEGGSVAIQARCSIFSASLSSLTQGIQAGTLEKTALHEENRRSAGKDRGCGRTVRAVAYRGSLGPWFARRALRIRAQQSASPAHTQKRKRRGTAISPVSLVQSTSPLHHAEELFTSGRRGGRQYRTPLPPQ